MALAVKWQWCQSKSATTPVTGSADVAVSKPAAGFVSDAGPEFSSYG